MEMYRVKQPVSVIAPGGVADRLAGTSDGLVMQMQQAALAALAPGAIAGRAVTLMVAASNASTAMRNAADYRCDGTADDVEINAALAAIATTGGVVLLSEGTFTLAASVQLNAAGQTLAGSGMASTLLRMVNSASTINWLVQITQSYGVVCDLTVDGNKANNSSSFTSGIGLSGLTAPFIQRVSVINCTSIGIECTTTIANGLIRDSNAQDCDREGYSIQASSGQPFIISGCTSQGNGLAGFTLSAGPIDLSDCQALNIITALSAAYGFNIPFASTAIVTMTNCMAQNCASYGFFVSGTTARARYTACRSINNTTYGFYTAGIQVQHIGCVAVSTYGYGFWNNSAAADALYEGCSAIGNFNSGFYHQSSSASYVGCRAIDNSTAGFDLQGGTALVKGCFIYGQAGSDYGINMAQGTRHVLHANRIQNMGRSGILSATVNDAQITNNNISDISLATNAGYYHVEVRGARVHIAGNMLRDPAAGNRPSYGINITGSAANCLLGYNDTSGVGVNGEIIDQSSSTRRIVELQLDYAPTADQTTILMSSAVTWYDFIPAQTFRVDSKNSLIVIACRGMLMGGYNGGTGATQVKCRLAVDGGTYYQYGGNTTDDGFTNQNVLAGGNPVVISGLSVGTHTVKLQTYSTTANTNVYCRSSSQLDMETFGMQVTEFSR